MIRIVYVRLVYRVFITPNLHIINSYDYRQDEMSDALFRICCRHADSKVWKRTLASLKDEWCVHNALYRLHILRSRTADVDLNYPCRAECLAKRCNNSR